MLPVMTHKSGFGLGREANPEFAWRRRTDLYDVLVDREGTLEKDGC